jgi:Holliday junction DNA helicase RuvA
MITKISGLLTELGEDVAVLHIAPFHYEVLVPDFTRRQLQMKIDQEVELHTIQYIDGNVQKGGRMTPRMIGFNSIVEREFFEMFCSVDGLGVKKALRAMVRPVPDVARAIEEQDVTTLKTLPGIGAATAERVVAKLRRKMAKFALLIPAMEGESSAAVSQHSLAEEVCQILLSLGHPEAEARNMVTTAAQSGKKIKDVETFLQLVYEQRTAE